MGKLNTFLNKKIVNEETAGKSYLTWKETLSYAIGRGAQGLSTSMMSSDNINFFASNVLKIKNLDIISQIRFWCGIWDAFNDPIMGILVDKTRTKDGKTRPYIRYMPFICAFFTCLLFMGSGEFSNATKIIFTIIAMVGWDMSYTAFDIPMGALAFSITPNAIERTKLYSVSSIVRAVVGAIPQVLILIAGWIPQLQEEPRPAYAIAAAMSAVGIIICTRPTYSYTRERATYSQNEPTLKECFSLLLTNKPLFMLFLSNMAFLLVTVQSSINSYVAIDLMGSAKYKTALSIAVAPAPFIAGIVTPMIVEKLGKKADFKKIYQGCCLVAVVCYIVFYLSCKNKFMNRAYDEELPILFVIAVVVFIALSRIPLEIKNLLGKEMEAETVDYVEWKTGERAEGVMLSLMSFTGKLTNSASSSIALFILARANYVTGDSAMPTPQTDTAKFALFACISLVPMVGYLLMLIPMSFYNINREQHDRMLKEIAERRAVAQED